MSEKFIIRETIDSQGKRVIVYEFPETEESGLRPRRRRRSRIPSSSFIKVTFEESRGRATRTGMPTPDTRSDGESRS